MCLSKLWLFDYKGLAGIITYNQNIAEQIQNKQWTIVCLYGYELDGDVYWIPYYHSYQLNIFTLNECTHICHRRRKPYDEIYQFLCDTLDKPLMCFSHKFVTLLVVLSVLLPSFLPPNISFPSLICVVVLMRF